MLSPIPSPCSLGTGAAGCGQLGAAMVSIMTRPSHEPQDSDIIGRILDGDVNAFELLVNRYKALVFGIVLKHVPSDRADDVAQEAFIEIYRSLGSYAQKSPFSHWLSKITVRCCYDYWRQQRKNNETNIGSLSEDAAQWIDFTLSDQSHEAFERQTAGREAGEVLAHAMAHLSAKDRMVLTLVHLDGYSIKEAADLLGWTQLNVKVRAHRSRGKLRKIISELLDDRRGRA